MKSLLTTAAILAVLAGIAFAPLLAPFSVSESHLELGLLTPNLTFWLGTDANGKDIFSLILYGSRFSLLISVCVVTACVLVGTMAGFVAGFYGGKTDKIFLFVADVFQAFPGILLAVAIAAFVSPSVFNLILLLSFVGWVSYARVVRIQVMELKTAEFIQAAHALGTSQWRLLTRHFLPNMAGPLIVQASFGMAGVILAESTLSFLGLGLPADIPTLGKLLDSGVNLLLRAPHVSLFPGAIIMIFVLSFNLLGDYLRDGLAA